MGSRAVAVGKVGGFKGIHAPETFGKVVVAGKKKSVERAAEGDAIAYNSKSDVSVAVKCARSVMC